MLRSVVFASRWTPRRVPASAHFVTSAVSISRLPFARLPFLTISLPAHRPQPQRPLQQQYQPLQHKHVRHSSTDAKLFTQHWSPNDRPLFPNVIGWRCCVCGCENALQNAKCGSCARLRSKHDQVCDFASVCVFRIFFVLSSTVVAVDKCEKHGCCAM